MILRVPTKVLYASYLPKVKDRDKLLAADSGMKVGNKPPIRNLLSSIPDEYLNNLDRVGSNPGNPNNVQVNTNNFNQPNVASNYPKVNPYSGMVVPDNPPPDDNGNMYNGEVGQGILGAAAAFDAILPYGKINRWPRVPPQEAYNPHPYGTGSQSLEAGGIIDLAKSGHWIQGAVNLAHKGYCTPMTKSTCTPRRKAFAKTMKKHHGFHEDGGSLSPSKAKEILHDGTAHGHPLTNKQRKFMGWKAGKKAPAGAVIGDPKKNILRNSAIGENELGNMQNSLTRRPTNMLDNVNYTLTHGGARTPGLGSLDPNETQLMTDAYIWSQRTDMRGKNPQQIIGSYFGRPVNAGNPVDALRSSLNQVNQGAISDYNQTPNVSVRDPKLVQPAIKSVASMKKGGKMKGKMIKYAQGGDIQTHWGGNAEPIAWNPYDGGTTQFSGDSHADGGIGMSYNGKKVEVEGGETAVRDMNGDLNIFGNMNIPGTKTKFKTVSKEIAEKEIKFDKLKTKGTNQVINTDPRNKYEQIYMNAGELMMKGGDIGQKKLAQSKQKLADLQNAMLDTAKDLNIDPQGMSQGIIKTAKKGMWIKAPFGTTIGGEDPKKKKAKIQGAISNDPTRSDRNNNPGNIQFGPFARSMGAKKADKDGFAIFPDRSLGFTAMTNLLTGDKYKGKDIDTAIKDWTGKKPYKYTLPDEMRNADGTAKKISELNPSQLSNLQAIMTQGEGTRYGAPKPQAPNIPLASTPPPNPSLSLPKAPPFSEPIPITTPEQPIPPPSPEQAVPRRRDIPTQAKPLGFGDVASDIFAISQNQERPVYAQKYTPQQYEPYTVSFQDRINNNNQTFNDIKRLVGANNPAALGTLAGQTYSANDAVRAEEFRTNQGISNQITNENIGLENDAELKNLGIADQQFTSQDLARSKTKEMNQIIVNSLSDKYNRVQAHNNELRAYENLYNFRLQPNQNTGGLDETNYNPDQILEYNKQGSNNPYLNNGTSNQRVITNYDKSGSMRNFRTVQDSDLNTQYKAIQLEQKKRKLPLLSAPKLFHGGYIKSM